MKPNTKSVQKSERPEVVPFGKRYESELSIVRAHLEAKALEDSKAMPDSVGVRNALFNSLTLWFLANGYSKEDKLDKDTKKELRASHEAYRAAVRTEAAIVVTVNGQAGEVVKLGKRRYAGFDKNGVPTRWIQPADVATGLTDKDLDEFLTITTDKLRAGVEAAKASAVK